MLSKGRNGLQSINFSSTNLPNCSNARKKHKKEPKHKKSCNVTQDSEIKSMAQF